MRSWIASSVVGVCLFATPSPLVSSAAAQEQRGSVEGVVRDASGAVLPGVIVEAKSPTVVGAENTVTDAAGAYRFPALPPGVYEFSATLQGFSPVSHKDVRVTLGQVLRVNLMLSPQGLNEAVQVTAEQPLIDVKQNAKATVITREAIDRLPVGRNFTDVAQFAPGAQQENRAGGLQIDGASGAENRFLVDGVDATNLRTGVAGKGLRMEFVEEVQVKTSGYNAEYRAATGGVISAITKSGSDQFHGSGTYFHEDSAWRGKVRRTLRQNPVDTNIAEYVTTKPSDYRSAEPVGDLGGPLLRNRLWFYAGGYGQYESNTRTVTFQQNQQTGTFDNKPETYNLLGNVTGQISRTLRGKFSVNSSRNKGQDITLPTIEPDGTSRDNPANFPDRVWTVGYNDIYTTTADWVPSSRLYFNVTGGYNRYGTRDGGASGTSLRHIFTASNLASASFNFPEIPASLRNPNGFSDTISNSRNAGDTWERYQVNADGTYYASAMGQHTFKGGVQFERITNDVNSGNQFPDIRLNWNASYQTFDNQSLRGKYGYYTVRMSTTVGSISSNNIGLFLQDSWTVNSRLTMNLGLRVEHEDVPSYRPENPGISFGWGDKITPRVGFAYDLGGSGKTKLYGSWGVFHDIMKLEMPRGSFGAARWVDYYFALDTFDWPSITCSYPPTAGSASCPGAFLGQNDFRFVSNSAERSLVDPDLKPMRSEEFTVGLDREVGPGMSVAARYVRKWIDRAIEDVGVITPQAEEFFLANPGYGVAEFTIGRDFPAQPIAKRQYDGLELEFRKRLSNRWQFLGIYTLSRLWGNYPGLASSDEPDTDGDGRTAPNVDRAFDGIYNSFDGEGNPVYGRLGSDRPHVFKMQASYDLPWGTMIGFDQRIQSGTPITREASNHGIPVFYKGRGSDGRTPVYSQTNVRLEHGLRLGATRARVFLDIFNLFDQDTATRFFVSPYRDNINVEDAVFFQGYDADALAAANPTIRKDARFLQANNFQTRRSMRLGVQFRF